MTRISVRFVVKAHTFYKIKGGRSDHVNDMMIQGACYETPPFKHEFNSDVGHHDDKVPRWMKFIP